MKYKKIIAREFLIFLLVVLTSILSLFVFYGISKYQAVKCKNITTELSKYNYQYDSVETSIALAQEKNIEQNDTQNPPLPQGVFLDKLTPEQSSAVKRAEKKINDLLNQKAAIENKPIKKKQSAKFVFFILLGLVYPIRGLFLMTVWSIKTMRKEE